MNIKTTALKAAQGIDTEDFLNHIAWDEIILPKLLETREILTKQLVDSVLNPGGENQPNREQIAGKIQGIDYLIQLLQKIIKEGREARAILQRQDMDLA